MLSTPYGKRGVFYREWSSGKRWTRLKVTAPECPRISPEFLAEERETLGDRWFRQEYLCEFLDTDTSVFAPELVEACLTDDVRPLFPDLL